MLLDLYISTAIRAVIKIAALSVVVFFGRCDSSLSGWDIGLGCVRTVCVQTTYRLISLLLGSFLVLYIILVRG